MLTSRNTMPQPTRWITLLCLCALLAEGAAQCTAPPRPPVTHIPSKSRWASWKGAQPLPTVTNSKEMSSFSLTLTLASFYVAHPAPCLSAPPPVSPPPGSAQINKNTTLSQIYAFYLHTEIHSQIVTEKQHWSAERIPFHYNYDHPPSTWLKTCTSICTTCYTSLRSIWTQLQTLPLLPGLEGTYLDCFTIILCLSILENDQSDFSQFIRLIAKSNQFGEQKTGVVWQSLKLSCKGEKHSSACEW